MKKKLRVKHSMRTKRRPGKINKLVYLFSLPLLVITLVVVVVASFQKQEIRQRAQTTSFKFVVWGDSRSGLSTLQSLSNQAAGYSPAFTLFTGDVENSGFTTSGANAWKTAMGSLFNKSFVIRGNHDVSNTSGWQSFYNFLGVASTVGATNYKEMTTDLTYSFDYGNSHFIGVDVPGNGSGISSSQVSWIDSDLTAAEAKGVTHSFIFFHGPIYYVANHVSSPPQSLISVLNKHNSVTSTFFGHEHVLAYVRIDSKRISTVTHPFDEFVSGAAGAPIYSCASGRSDWCSAAAGFLVVEVSGTNVKSSYYKNGSGSPAHVVTSTKSTTLTSAPVPTAITPTFVCGGSQSCVPTISPTSGSGAVTPYPTTIIVQPTETTNTQPTTADINQGPNNQAEPSQAQNNNGTKNGNVKSKGLIQTIIAFIIQLIMTILKMFTNLFK